GGRIGRNLANDDAVSRMALQDDAQLRGLVLLLLLALEILSALRSLLLIRAGIPHHLLIGFTAERLLLITVLREALLLVGLIRTLLARVKFLTAELPLVAVLTRLALSAELPLLL